MITRRLQRPSTAAGPSLPYNGDPPTASSEVVDMLDQTLQPHNPLHHSSNNNDCSRQHAPTSSAGVKRKQLASKTHSSLLQVVIKRTSSHRFHKKPRVATNETTPVQAAHKFASSTVKGLSTFETSMQKGLSEVGLGVNRPSDGSVSSNVVVESTDHEDPNAPSNPEELEKEVRLLGTPENLKFLDHAARVSERKASLSKKQKSRAPARAGAHDKLPEKYEGPRTRSWTNKSQDSSTRDPKEEAISQKEQSQHVREESRSGLEDEEESGQSPARQPGSPGSPQPSSHGRSASLDDQSHVEPVTEHPNTIPETAEDQLQVLTEGSQPEEGLDMDQLEEDDFRPLEDGDEEVKEEVDEGGSLPAAELERFKRSHQQLDEQAERERREHEQQVRERNRQIAQQVRERSKVLLGGRPAQDRRVGQQQDSIPEAVDQSQLPPSRSSAGGGINSHASVPSPSADCRPDTRGGVESAQEEALVEGLLEFQGPTRYIDILRKYGQPGQPLQSWDLDEIFKRAREFKQNYLDNYEAKPSSKAPAPWLLSV